MYFSNTSAEQSQQAREQESFSLIVLDESGYIQNDQLEAVGAQSVESKEQGVAAVQNADVDAFFYYPANPTVEKIEVYNKDDGLFENFKYPTIATNLLTSGAAEEVGSSELLQIAKGEDIETNQVTYSEGVEVRSFEQLVLPGIFLAVFFFIIIFLSGQMLTSTTEEKENRVIEMILTTVRPRALIIGKVIAILGLGLVQALVLTAPLIIGAIFFRDMIQLPNIDMNAIFDVDPWRIFFGAAFLISGIIFFTGLLVAISAAVPTAKDANNFLGFTMLAMFVPFYAAMSILTDPEQIIVQIFSYFPLTAPTTLLLRNAVGNLSYLEAAIGLGILIIFGIAAITIAARIFRSGTLQYSRMLSFREIFKKQ